MTSFYMICNLLAFAYMAWTINDQHKALMTLKGEVGFMAGELAKLLHKEQFRDQKRPELENETDRPN